MPSDNCLPNIPIPLPLALYVIPLAFMVEFIVQQLCVTVEGPSISFSPFSLADCTLLNHFSFDDVVAVAFPDIAGDLNIQI